MYAGMAAVRTGQTSAYLQGNFGTSAPPRVANYLTRAFARPVLRPRVVRGAVIVLVFDMHTDQAGLQTLDRAQVDALLPLTGSRPCISPISPLYLPPISPVSPLYLAGRRAAAHALAVGLRLLGNVAAARRAAGHHHRRRHAG